MRSLRYSNAFWWMRRWQPPLPAGSFIGQATSRGHALAALLKDLVRTARLVHPDPGLLDVLWRAKYCLRGLALPRLTYEWFRLLQSQKLAVVAATHPHIRSKLQRPYLNRTLAPRERLRALENHYRL